MKWNPSPAAAIFACLLLLGATPALADPLLPVCGTPLLPRPGSLPRVAAKLQAVQPFKVGDPLTVPAFSFRLGDKGHYQTTTTCRFVGRHCYIFVEDEVWGTLTQAGIDSLAGAFDRTTPRDAGRGIYSIDTDLFGPPPDVDGDSRILIVLLDILDSPITGTTFVGYFDTENQGPPTSREILYIDTHPLDITGTLARATLTHEFQHMLHWWADPDEDKWVDEGCSEYAELACGYKDTTQTAAAAFLEYPSTSLTLWEDLPFHFDQSFLWMTYFVQRSGEAVLKPLLSEPENGIAGINGVLASRNTSQRFETLFADWMAATYLDGPAHLGYQRLDLGPVHRSTVAVPTQNRTRKVRLWGTDYLALEASPGLSIDITGAGDSDLLTVLIAERDTGPAVTSLSIPAGARKRINAFGPDARTLAVTRTSGETEDYTFTIVPLDGTSVAASDFDASGKVDFTDFVLFARNFGYTTADPGFTPTYDLDGDRRVAFSDFVIFAENFGASP